MDHFLMGMWEIMAARISGPLKFRVILQPSMAVILAIRSGLRDARKGKPAYFWELATDSAERRAMLKDGWRSIGKLFILATVLDAIYQYIVQRWIYPLDAVLIAVILAIVPYLLVRGPVNRIARRMRNHAKEIKVGG